MNGRIIMTNKNLSKIFVGLILCLVVIVQGAVIFQDDFSVGANSNLNWVLSDPDYVNKSFENGTIIIKNTDTDKSGLVYHELTNKPTVFTVSSKISRSGTSVFCGLFIELIAGTSEKIVLLIGENAVYFGKLGENINPTATPFIDSEMNTLMVSMDGKVCNVFVNSHFVATYTYSGSYIKNIGYIVDPNTIVAADDFVMTDEFTQGGNPISFSDSFENGLTKDWLIDKPESDVSIDSGKLKIKTGNTDNAYVNMTVDVDLADDFKGKASFSHKSGSTNKIYGFILEGNNQSDRAYFAIVADKLYWTMVGNESPSSAQKQSIRGKAYTDAGTGAITYYIDTLEIIKKAGSAEYIFVANRDTLIRLTNITFPVKKAGIYCHSGIDLTVDDFSFISTGSSSVIDKHSITKRVSDKSTISNYRGTFIFDPLGRVLSLNRIRDNRISSGIYLLNNKNQNSKKNKLYIK